MKLIVKFSPVLAVLALAMACGDDDDTNSDATQCVSPYTDRTEAKLKDQTGAQGACADDSAAVCRNDVITQTSMCAQSCFTMYPDDAAMQTTCTEGCLKDVLSPVPSDGCLDCYLQSVACTAKFCLAECLMGGAAAPACTSCRLENGCTANFYACSGLPIPANPSGGTSSGGGSGKTGGSNGTTGGVVGMGGDAGAAGMSTAGTSSGGTAGAAGMSSGATSGATGGGADSVGGAGGNSGAGGI